MSCAQNAFVGATPRHAIVAKYLELAMLNVQRVNYPIDALLVTGPCVFGHAIKLIRKDFGNDTVSWPIHKTNTYYWKGQEIVLSKCEGCGHGQDWDMGNNYYKLWKNKRYYCEDSASIFHAPFL